MHSLKYSVIKSAEQYDSYCSALESLLELHSSEKNIGEEIELLELLISKYDDEHRSIRFANPVELLKSLMDEHELKASDLVNILGVSKGLVSDILNYKKGFSKESIRKLSAYFKVSQEVFNRPYPFNPFPEPPSRKKGKSSDYIKSLHSTS